MRSACNRPVCVGDNMQCYPEDGLPQEHTAAGGWFLESDRAGAGRRGENTLDGPPFCKKGADGLLILRGDGCALSVQYSQTSPTQIGGGYPRPS